VEEDATPRLGPNDRQPCPSRACAIWHAAHGYPHICGGYSPHWRRMFGDDGFSRLREGAA
jgi:hypothetical protein